MAKKNQGRRLVCSKDRVETNGRTDGQTDRETDMDQDRTETSCYSIHHCCTLVQRRSVKIEHSFNADQVA